MSDTFSKNGAEINIPPETSDKLRSMLVKDGWVQIDLKYSKGLSGKFKDFPTLINITEKEELSRVINMVITPYCKETRGLITMLYHEIVGTKDDLNSVKVIRKIHKIIGRWDVLNNNLHLDVVPMKDSQDKKR